MIFPPQRKINPGNQMYHRPNMRGPFHQSYVNRAPQNNIQRLLSRFQQSPSSITSLATKSAGNISQTLNNIQQVLNVVQTATPIVQEYGPMVKNLPAMYRMMKAFKDLEEMEDTDTEEVEEGKEEASLNAEKEIALDEEIDKEEPKQQRFSSESIPKLYI